VSHPTPDEVKEAENKVSMELGDEMVDEELPELKEIPCFYKYANPLNLLELEWKVTLSRYDFPW
jgi:hypothetical protein